MQANRLLIAFISQQLQDEYCIVNFSIANEIELQGIDYVDVIFIIMEQLFVLHRRPLVSLKMKMIISFPIHMVYTADFRLLQDDFDKCVLYSMIKVNNSDHSRYEPGIAVMKEIVERRMNLDLIEEDTLDYYAI